MNMQEAGYPWDGLKNQVLAPRLCVLEIKHILDGLHCPEVWVHRQMMAMCLDEHGSGFGTGLPSICECFLPGAASRQLYQPLGQHENPWIHFGHTQLRFWKAQRVVLVQMILLKWDREQLCPAPSSSSVVGLVSQQGTVMDSGVSAQISEGCVPTACNVSETCSSHIWQQLLVFKSVFNQQASAQWAALKHHTSFGPRWAAALHTGKSPTAHWKIQRVNICRGWQQLRILYFG